MKKIIYCLVIGVSLATVISCAKKKTEAATPTYQDPSKADDASARNEMDKAYSDVETVYNSQDYASASGMRTSGAILPCGSVTIDTTHFTINYNGVNCGTRVLGGSIDVTLVSGTKFSDPNAVLRIIFQNYKVLYQTNNQSITYNGTSYITNGPNGGSLLSLFTSTSALTVEHKERGQLNLTFDSTGTGTANVTRQWNVFRKRTYTTTGTSATGISLSIAGDTSIGSGTYIPGTYPNASEYGISRDGDKFVCNMPTNFLWANCGTTVAGPYTLKQGEVDYTVDLTNNIGAKAIGITKGTWNATAGYKYDATNKYAFDGSCGSDGYKIDFALQNASNVNVYTSTVFQEY